MQNPESIEMGYRYVSSRAAIQEFIFWRFEQQSLFRLLMVFEKNMFLAKTDDYFCLKSKAPQFSWQHQHVVRIMALVYTRQLLLVTALTRSTINMPKFHSPLPCAAALCWGVWTSLERDGGMEDAALTLENPNNCSKQVLLIFLSNPELSKDELTQSIFLVVSLFFF